MPPPTLALSFLAAAAAAAWFGALGPAHRAELFALASFVLLASLTRVASRAPHTASRAATDASK